MTDLQKTLAIRLNANRKAADGIAKTLPSLENARKLLSQISSLSDTANGGLTGKERVTLETYVQMTYFDRILERANVRLMIMSDAQYELRRRETPDSLRSKSGLELDVVDHYNGTLRSVGSLSGGESFKASLSLALGLSEEVCCEAGGIRLDSMFVDEGFGSLDEESLEQAMRALSDLAQGSRSVGIISHVQALQDRIDRRIEVTKTRSGGSHAIIKT